MTVIRKSVVVYFLPTLLMMMGGIGLVLTAIELSNSSPLWETAAASTLQQFARRMGRDPESWHPWIRVAAYAFSGIIVFMGLERIMRLRSWSASVKNQALTITAGLLIKDTEIIELFRIREIDLKRYFPLSILGVGTIDVYTVDQRIPIVALSQIQNSAAMAQDLQQAIIQSRGFYGPPT